MTCWGYNRYAQLGTGNTTDRSTPSAPLNIGAGRTAVAIQAGWMHSCALLDNGEVKCWGADNSGQVGSSWLGAKLTPTTVNLGTGKVAVSIEAGRWHTCAILSEGSLKCWGWNFYGQLGLGDNYTRGDNPGEMGDNLPTVKLFSNVW